MAEVPPCGLDADSNSLIGAIRLYKQILKRMKDPTLTRFQKSQLREQRRCLIDVFGPAVRMSPETLLPEKWQPEGRFMTIPATDQGAVLLLVGKGGRVNKTYFIPFRSFSSGDIQKGYGGYPAYVIPGNFDKAVNPDKLADELLALCDEISPGYSERKRLKFKEQRVAKARE
jgi:hypothetical protein